MNCGPQQTAPPNLHGTDWTGDTAVKYIKQAVVEDKPFYLQVREGAPVRVRRYI